MTSRPIAAGVAGQILLQISRRYDRSSLQNCSNPLPLTPQPGVASASREHDVGPAGPDMQTRHRDHVTHVTHVPVLKKQRPPSRHPERSYERAAEAFTFSRTKQQCSLQALFLVS